MTGKLLSILKHHQMAIMHQGSPIGNVKMCFQLEKNYSSQTHCCEDILLYEVPQKQQIWQEFSFSFYCFFFIIYFSCHYNGSS